MRITTELVKAIKRLREPWEGRVCSYSDIRKGLMLPWTFLFDHQSSVGLGKPAQSQSNANAMLQQVLDRFHLELDLDAKELFDGFSFAFKSVTSSLVKQGGLFVAVYTSWSGLPSHKNMPFCDCICSTQ